MNIYQRIVLILGAIALFFVIWKPQLNVVRGTVIPKSYLSDLYFVISENYDVGEYSEFYEKIKLPERRKRLYSFLFYCNIINKSETNWKDILEDLSFQKQPKEVKEKVAENYYKKNISLNKDYQSQPQEIKDRVREIFFNTIEPDFSNYTDIELSIIAGRYDIFEKILLSSLDQEPQEPYVRRDYVFNLEQGTLPVRIIGVVGCTLLVFFALKGIGRKKKKQNTK